MPRILNRISIAWQFTLLFIMAITLMLSGTALTLAQKYNLEMADKRAQITALAQAGQSVIEAYVAQAQSGAMSTAQAQAAAARAIAAIRYNGNGYLFVQTYQGIYVVHPNKAMLGKSGWNARDAAGHLITQPMLRAAMAGTPQFNEYEYPRVPGGQPFPKIGYMLSVPQWQWAVGTGVYVDDIRDEMISNTIWLVIIFTPLLLGFMASVLFMRRGITVLLTSLAHAMRQLAAGNVSVVIPGMERRDELRDMAAAVQVFKDNAIEKQRLAQEVLAAQEVAERERIASETRRQKELAQQQDIVTALADGLARLAEGDLQYRLLTQFAPAYEKLRGDFNGAMERLQKTMLEIINSTQAVHGQAGQMLQASNELAQRTEQQAASLTQTATSLHQVTATVRETAINAEAARASICDAGNDAKDSGKVVQKTVAAMGSIEDSSRKIENISGVIDEIAFQTNLLALNAGVEAARAGDAGRGFAVVATEVRALAQRSADAAKEIKSLIAASRRQVETGVKLVGETGQALAKIVAQVDKITALVVNIASSAGEQASGLVEVNGAVSQMDQVTQKNVAIVEESTAASHTLASEAQALTALLASFRIGNTNAATNPKKPDPKPAAKPRPALAHAGTESWDEF